MKLYNTLTRTVEEFTPREAGKVKMYTCGPTVYNFAHIGNLRTYLMEDVLEKTLRYIGYDVRRVMNITDIGHLSSDADTGEDKMLLGARREHKTVLELAQYYTDAFLPTAPRSTSKSRTSCSPPRAAWRTSSKSSPRSWRRGLPTKRAGTFISIRPR